jgi:hypothetical protein
VRERQARAERDLGADDAAAAEKVGLAAVHVHRPAEALGGASALAHELRHHLEDRAAAREVLAVVAVGRDERVVARQRRLEARHHRLLPVVQVAEAADELGLVHLCARVCFFPWLLVLVGFFVLGGGSRRACARARARAGAAAAAAR